MKQYTIIIAAGVAAIVIAAVVFSGDILKLSIPTQEYDIFVDPILDKQSLFVMGRVTIQNIGSQPLTNIHVNFGAGDTLDHHKLHRIIRRGGEYDFLSYFESFKINGISSPKVHMNIC